MAGVICAVVRTSTASTTSLVPAVIITSVMARTIVRAVPGNLVSGHERRVVCAVIGTSTLSAAVVIGIMGRTVVGAVPGERRGQGQVGRT
jgi:hypothetical protein